MGRRGDAAEGDSAKRGSRFVFDNGRTVCLADANEYLRMLALARLYLDNIHNMQSSWVTMGPKIGQLALFFGANDMGSVMMEENVVSAAGTSYRLDEAMICRLIRDAGWIPASAISITRCSSVTTGRLRRICSRARRGNSPRGSTKSRRRRRQPTNPPESVETARENP